MTPTRERDSSLTSTLIQRIDRVDLRVRDIEGALAFYRDVAGLRVVEQGPAHASLGDEDGTVILFLSSEGVTEPADPSATGLFHTAFRFPTRASLGDVLSRLVDAQMDIGASDHLVSEALYVDDPDRNGVELYWDRPIEQWPPPTESMAIPMASLPLDLESVLAEGTGADAVRGSAPSGTDIGHVHLQVSDLYQTTRFYLEVLGLDQTATIPGSGGFFSSNGYHHHLGANIWRSRHGRPADPGRAGLARVLFKVGSTEELEDLRTRLNEAGVVSESDGDAVVVRDPDGIELHFSI